jgi:hypothetical protein
LRRLQTYPAAKYLTAAALISALILTVPSTATAQEDPNRPPCTDANCRKIETFLRAHYCGQSPFGNGPEDGYQIRFPKKLRQGIEVVADFNCKWSEAEGTTVCHQRGQPSPNIRTILVRELHHFGLPRGAGGKIYFTVWKSTLLGWSLALADYSHLVGDSLTLSEEVLIISPKSHVTVLRKVPFQKTNADVPDVTEWVPIDLVDVDGNGELDVVLEADAYEDHWFEVVTLRNDSAVTIFSGLGYYL